MPIPKLSIVTTVYNDSAIVPFLVADILKYVEPLNISYEIILVNDNSPDDSQKVIENECLKNKNIKGILLSRNFGQQIAMSAGIAHAKGELILIMDGDMQNPPKEIPKLYAKINEGFEIVYCVAKTRNNFFDNLSSSIFWFFLVKFLKVKIVKNQLMMKIMTRKFVDQFNIYNEINRTISGIVQDIGLSHDVIEIENNKRLSGKSNYNYFKRFNLMIDIVISLSRAPLNFMIYLGGIIFILTCFYTIYHLYQYLFNTVTPGFTSIMLTISFFGSIIILMLGFIGRYLSNIYVEVRQRPIYIVQKKCNFDL